MKDIRAWILDRLKEKTTWASIAALLALFGIEVAPETLGEIGAGIIALVGVFGVAYKEA